MANPFELLTQITTVKEHLEKTAQEFDGSNLLLAIAGSVQRYVLQTTLNLGPPPGLAEALGVNDAQAKKLYIVILNAALRRNETWKTTPTLPQSSQSMENASENIPNESLRLSNV